MLRLGIDDTDSRRGGCTTALADGLLSLFADLEPLGAPRLVRLNPNVPWKTRGNGAVALAFARDGDLDEVLARASAHVRERAARDPGTSPGVVASVHPLDPGLYLAAVTRVVEPAEALAAVAAAGGRAWGGRGVIGAAAALAWPARRTTWERIAYRDPALVGTPRRVDPAAVARVEREFPSIFDSYDLVEDDVVCVPSSPCPVLWGLRGDDPDDLARASAALGPERPARETLFLTNQGTDDHLVDGTTADARACASLRVRARVAEPPRERNGHAFVEVRDEAGVLRAAAYAPTRSFRRVLLSLAPGDDVTVCGGVHDGPDGRPTLGVEKLLLHEAVPRRAGNPLCCGRSMKSAGARAGFRCLACGARAATPRLAEAPLRPGWHEVPSSARRHLARPVGRK